MKASERLVQRHPLAWGMVKFGPLPGTEDMFLFWDGPESGIYLGMGTGRKPQKRIEHPSASGTYATVEEAEKAVTAFVQAGIA
jgi:hypothetical protein